LLCGVLRTMWRIRASSTATNTAIMPARFTIKQILISNQNWWRFYNKHHDKIRVSILYCITKLLSCKNTLRGYQPYSCSNQDCAHTKSCCTHLQVQSLLFLWQKSNRIVDREAKPIASQYRVATYYLYDAL